MLPSIKDNDIIPLIRQVTNSLKTSLGISETTELNGVFTSVVCCSTLWLTKSTIFEKDGFTYQVEEVVTDEYFNYVALDGGTGVFDELVLNYPYLLVGTPSLASEELKQLGSNLGRFPFIWVLEIFTTRFQQSTLYDAISTLSIFVLDCADSSSWLNYDHREKVLKPMKSLTDEFLIALQSHKNIGEIDDLAQVDRINFGAYSNNKGNVKDILPEKLTGVEIRLDIPIFEINKCKTKNC